MDLEKARLRTGRTFQCRGDQMKYSLIAGACLVLAQATFAQSVYSAEQVLSRERVLRDVLSTGIWDGHVIKQLRTEGDAAAVLLTKIVAGRDLGRSDVDAMLD